MPFAATSMDLALDIIIPSEFSQTERGKYIWSLTGRIEKLLQIEQFYKAETDSQT